jgi:hypothetical protein
LIVALCNNYQDGSFFFLLSDDFAPMRFQRGQRTDFIGGHQAGIARDIRRQNSCQSSLYVLAAQGSPHARGN